ncbi:hypothetical protein JCM19302_3689 [Jejuia pallidilutea]|uniref:Uncharacterized protein n=1 Tax=Jejuia pallidilutea TaxID=504487 RepID=A0A090VXP0_9FLAO|nr:hypothetical protein JCM19302_3689 [Jejuia pallidilutea]
MLIVGHCAIAVSDSNKNNKLKEVLKYELLEVVLFFIF